MTLIPMKYGPILTPLLWHWFNFNTTIWYFEMNYLTEELEVHSHNWRCEVTFWCPSNGSRETVFRPQKVCYLIKKVIWTFTFCQLHFTSGCRDYEKAIGLFNQHTWERYFNHQSCQHWCKTYFTSRISALKLGVNLRCEIKKRPTEAESLSCGRAVL